MIIVFEHLHGLSQVLRCEMSIALSHAPVAVTEQPLYPIEIHALLHERRGKGMPQVVKRKFVTPTDSQARRKPVVTISSVTGSRLF